MSKYSPLIYLEVVNFSRIPYMSFCYYCSIIPLWLLAPNLTVEVVEMGVRSISLTWSVSRASVVSSEVVWRPISGSGASGSSSGLSSTSYTIPDLQEFSVYNITVTVNTAVSGTSSESVISFTGHWGICQYNEGLILKYY